MEVLYGERQSGKTTRLIKKAHEERLYIVCLDRKRVEYIAKTAMDMGLDIKFPLHLGELPLRGSFITEVLVDDLDHIIEDIIGRKVRCATVTNDDY